MKLLCLVTIAILACGVTSNIKKDFLKEHNRLRRKHGANKLKWDKNLASFAQNHCDMLADTNTFEHNKELENKGYGENLFKSWGSAAGGFAEAAVMAWYQEIKDYDFSNPGYSAKTGHFTQVGRIYMTYSDHIIVLSLDC